MVPYLRVANVLDGYIDYSDVYAMHFSDADEKKYAIRKGDILLNEGQSTELVGRCAIFDGPEHRYCYQNSLVRFRCGPAVIPQFARAVFKRWLDIGHFTTIVKQTTSMAHLGSERFAELEFPLAPLPEQRRIAEILGTLEEAISKTERLIAKLKQVKSGLLHDLLTRGIDGNGEVRDPDCQPEQFTDSPLGLIPRHWKLMTLASGALGITDGDHHTPRRCEAGVFLLSARNVADGELDLSHVDYVDETEYRRMIRRCHPESEDVLISCSGSIGRIALVSEGLRCVLVRSVALVKPNREIFTPSFLALALRSDPAQRQIMARKRQAVQGNLFQSEIAGLVVPVPGMEEQRQISGVISAAEARLLAEENERAKLCTLRHGIMEDLLTGSVRVTKLASEQAA